MSLLSDRDRVTVANELTAITRPVTLLFFTQTFGAPETVQVTKQILSELAALNDHITVEEVNFVLDKERTAQFGVEDVPTIAVLGNGHDTGIRFLGAPAGYEFMSLVEAVIAAGTGDSGLSESSRQLIAQLATEPIGIQVFVTPTCPHCPRAVTLAHRMAVESANIQASCIEATEFLELSRKYRVTGVPKTVVNGTTEILGALPEDQFVRAVLGQPEPDTAATS